MLTPTPYPEITVMVVLSKFSTNETTFQARTNLYFSSADSFFHHVFLVFFKSKKIEITEHFVLPEPVDIITR